MARSNHPICPPEVPIERPETKAARNSSSGLFMPLVFEPDNEEVRMTLRSYAAIHLRVADSGIDWLDEMIRQSRRLDLVK